MPEIVGHGRRPDVRACGYCHLPNGQGRPENSSLAGLPAAYIVQQMADYKNGLRKSSEPKMGPPAAMITIGKNANDAEVKAAVEYFSGLKPKQWIRVVESKTVPVTRVAGGMLVPVEGGGTEPMGQRIVEMPENLERTELRDSASGFVAYVPAGSIKKGEALAATGGAGKTIRCSICHGADLKGLGNVPSIAGRSPSYLVRQLYDIQSGVRVGPWTVLMKEAVVKLTPEDMVAIGAYAASLAP
jgi:cytochrome c553